MTTLDPDTGPSIGQPAGPGKKQVAPRNEGFTTNGAINFPDRQVAFAGDWEGERSQVYERIRELRLAFPDVRTIFHTGDFSPRSGAEGRNRLLGISKIAVELDFRIFVTPGNHEDWGRLNALFAFGRNRPEKLEDRLFVVPPGLRMRVGGRLFIFVGGAASLDEPTRQAHAKPGFDEVASADVYKVVMEAGPVDVLVTHETINGGTAASEKALRTNPGRWTMEALASAARSRAATTALYEALRPTVFVHGHMHVSDERHFDDDRSIYSMGWYADEKNTAVLDLDDLSWTWVQDRLAVLRVSADITRKSVDLNNRLAEQ